MKFCKFIIFLLICVQVPLSQGCRTLFADNPEKRAMKKQERSDKEFEKAYDQIKKEHLKNQTRATRKRMNQSKKAAEKMNKRKKTKSKRKCL